MAAKKHSSEYVITIAAGIMLIMNSSAFIASIFTPFEDETLERLRMDLGDEGFRLFQIRVIIASIISGSMLIILAIIMERNPKDLRHYGIMIIIVSIVSIIGIGLIYPVSIIAALVGVAGGSIAIIRSKKIIEITYKEAYKESETDIEYLCTKCNLRFSSDEEMRKHMLKHFA